MPGQLQSIVALQKNLIELAAAEARLAGIPEWMQELHEEHSAQNAEIEALAAAAEAAALERRAAEAAVADAQEKQTHYQEQISLVSTQREYGALLKEIDTVKELINTSEREALEALERHDEAKSRQEELVSAFADLDQRYKAELEKWEKEKPAVNRSVKKLRKQVAELRDGIPIQIESFFDRLYSRYGEGTLAGVIRLEPAARSRNNNAIWHCTACSFRVRPQVVVEIQNEDAVIQCDSCKRILYFEVEPPGSEDA